MAQIVMSIQQSGNRLDGSVRRAAYAFLEKLSEDDTRPGLHVEPINNAADSRVRTARVDQFWRAVMFKVQGQAAQAHYVYLGVWPHDDAIALAQRAILTVNPVNGIAELIMADDRRPTTTPPPPSVNNPEPVEVAAVLGHLDPQTLVDRLGLDSALVARALAATSDDSLLTIIDGAVEWQGSALLDLASGATYEEVAESLSLLDAPDEPRSTDSDEALIDALKHPAARMQFAFVEDNEELRRAVEEGDFEAWRVFLHPEQREYVERHFGGPFRLSGGAGTGKTVVLLHRARMLHRADPQARIVLTTFTKTLAEAMKRDLRSLDPEVVLAPALGEPGIHVAGVDSIVSAALRTARGAELSGAVSAVLGSRSGRVQGRNVNTGEQWRESIKAAAGDVPADLQHAGFFEAEYVLVVLPGRVIDRESYFRARRPGRGVALDRARRSAVWEVVSRYRATSNVNGAVDFAEAAAIGSAMLDARSERLADHVLVDEGQDLNPPHWQFLRSLVAEGADDLFIAEDSHQRIYGQRVVLGRLGIKIVGRSRRLALNYRTTAQNLNFAVSVLSGDEFLDLEEGRTGTAGYRSARTGPEPLLVGVSSVTEELERASEIVSGWLDEGVVPDTIGILVRDASQANQVSRGLKDRDVAVRVVTNRAAISKLPQVMTMHRAKGMEFSRVLIFGADSGSLPASYLMQGMNPSEREDYVQRERSLLYVAATRAREELVVLWSGDKSVFLG